MDEPRKCWRNCDEGHTRSRAPERRANNEAGARGVGGARHGARAHARAPARALLLPWAAAERQQQAARPCLTRQHGRGVPSLARNGRRKEQRSSARAEERNAKPHTQARAAYPDAPAPLRRQEPPARDAHYARCARRAGVAGRDPRGRGWCGAASRALPIAELTKPRSRRAEPSRAAEPNSHAHNENT